MKIDQLPPPEGSLIAPFLEAEAHYCDAFRLEIPEPVPLARYIAAFYTTPLFKAERLVLRLAGLPSSDAEAEALAQGSRDAFAAWTVEGRREDEILLGDLHGRTKSWLAVRGDALWFGSVVVPVMRRGKLTLGPVFDSLIRAHVVYSRALLSAAGRRVKTRAA